MAYYKLHFQNKCTNGKCCGYIGSCLIDVLISELVCHISMCGPNQRICGWMLLVLITSWLT